MKYKMGYKAAVQVLKKADPLKLKITSQQCDLINDFQAWTDQQQLQTIYHQVLVLDLDYALDKKVEQELWTLGFKNHISILQEQARDKKNARRSESQALLSWCLEAASGFYLTLLQELSSTYDLDLPFRKHGAVFGNLKCNNYNESSSLPQPASCLYICQYCLVHLGDIARYRNQRKQAESFYKHAILVSPNSGHPYNQLALLEASQGDKLSTVFHYVRGIAVKNPFPGAGTNLASTLSVAFDKDDILTEVQTKMTVNEFIALFLKAHSLLHNDSDLRQAELCVRSITSTLTALVATQSFTSEKLIKMSVINLYALRRITGEGDVMNVSALTPDELKVRELVLDLLAGSLSAFLLPVYTLKSDESLLDYYALAAIRLISIWIRSEPQILTDDVFANRLQIWPGYCRLLNSLQTFMKLDDPKKYDKLPLSYDRDLQGFLPLQDCYKMYDFGMENESGDLQKQVRAKRLVDFGTWLSGFEIDGKKLMTCSRDEDSKRLQFEPACIQPDPTDELLEEMKSFKIADADAIKVPEKRGGILKPQGSLEKSREERVQVKLSDDGPTSRIDTAKLKRITQNVALQSIYKKIEENKQVKFSAETTDRDKTSPKMKPPIQKQVVGQGPVNQTPYRTQTFNQNHPALANLSMDNDFFGNYPQQQQAPPPPNPNLQYQNTNDLLKMQFSMPPPNIFSNPPPNVSNFTPLIEKPISYNTMPPYSFNNKEQNNWWPNQNQQHLPPPQQPQDYYRYGFPPNNQGTDLFSPWNRNPQPTANMGYGNQAMSMRQAMLNESKHMAPGNQPVGNNNLVNSAPGYSLFNPTSWAPSLPGQLRNNANNQDMRQQSLFSAVPQSLQQLLEQQNKLQKGGDT